jgi:tetratricopeptide (TPR) repeat protein
LEKFEEVKQKEMKEEDFDLIDKYKSGLLNNEELEALKLRTAQDTEFSDFLQMEENLQGAFQFNEAKMLKESFILEDPHVTIPFYKTTLFKVAATIFAIIVSTILLLNQKPDFNEVYAQYYEPYPNVVAPILRSGSTNNEAFVLYEASEYQEALAIFREQDEKTNTFYIGQCLLAMGSYAEAADSFKTIKETDSKFAVPSQWYLALAYLQLDNEKEARAMLYNLKDNKTQYAQKAREMLEALE